MRGRGGGHQGRGDQPWVPGGGHTIRGLLVGGQGAPGPEDTAQVRSHVESKARLQSIMSRWETFNIHSTEAGGCDGNYVEVVDGLNTGDFRRLIPKYARFDLINKTTDKS